MKRVLLLLPNGFEVLEAAAFVDVLGWADAYGAEHVDVVTAARESRVRAAFGLRVLPDMQLADVSVAGFDALALPGGFETAGYYDDAYAAQFLDVIRQFRSAGKPIASICVGALPLGKSGALAGVRATTYSLGDGKRVAQLKEMGVDVSAAALVRDGSIITSSSPSTAADVAFTLLEILTSRDNAAAIRALMGFRPGEETKQ